MQDGFENPDQGKTPWYASEGFCKLLIISAALTWGLSFIVIKDVVARFPVFFVLAVRFAISTVILFVLFRERFLSNLDRRTILIGLLVGLLCWGGYAFQTFGIVYTTPGKNAFISGTYCVMVPFAAWAIGSGKPERTHVFGAFLCVIGLGFVGLDGSLMPNIGDALTLCGAVVYAFEFAVLGRYAGELDVWAVTIWEFIAMTVLNTASTLLTETPPSLELFDLKSILVFLFLSLFCSCFASTSLNYALKKVDPTQAALLSSLESPSGVLFSILFAEEVLIGRVVVGFAFIFVAMIVSEIGAQIIAALPDLPLRVRK
ncbi:MAG: DMT family transporter [Atopobiaceae bacterium]|nr:DMT family transporter [Atopobiaceae bacterium]